MAQYLKDAVKDQISSAALQIFSAQGFKQARISDIARKANISTGNIYRYYKNKDDLFHSIITDTFTRSFIKLLRKRISALTAFHGDGSLSEEASKAQQELLDFWIENRLKVVIVLAKSEGSKYANFRQTVLDQLVKSTIADAANRPRQTLLDLENRFILKRIFQNTLDTIVAILAEHEDAKTIASLFKMFWTYQVAGINALTEH